jgi:hypothetical protein
MHRKAGRIPEEIGKDFGRCAGESGLTGGRDSLSESTAAASSSVTPANAAVLPADANGTFTVILESSMDLNTWTAANPGDYSGSASKRFFRTRIVKK